MFRTALLHVVCDVISDGPQTRVADLSNQISQRLAGRSDRTEEVATVEPEVRAGSPSLEITRVAKEQGADFIYIPWKQVFGGTAMHLSLREGIEFAQTATASVSRALFARFQSVPLSACSASSRLCCSRSSV